MAKTNIQLFFKVYNTIPFQFPKSQELHAHVRMLL